MVDPKKNQKRKEEHIDICIDGDAEYRNLDTGFGDYNFIHQALPEIDYDKIELGTEFLGKRLDMPLMISPITGGTENLYRINHDLAGLASSFGLAMGLGSARIALEDNNTSDFFKVRDVAPDILLFANLGAVQLNNGYSSDHCRKIVEMTEADALMLHLNPMQEVFQSEGDRDFSDLLSKISALCDTCEFPVVVREVGFGISKDVARRLIYAGVSAIDLSGSGGTSWVKIESQRSNNKISKRVAQDFEDWGIPTTRSLESIKELKVQVPLIASGGIRSGLDIAKSLALGADIAGVALPLLRAIKESKEGAVEYIEYLRKGLKTAMFGVGVSNVRELKKTKSLVKG